MDWFLKILGMLISLAFIFIGFVFMFKPKKAIQSLQKIKYKNTGDPKKNEINFSIIIGILLTLIGVYYLAMDIVSIIYPA